MMGFRVPSALKRRLVGRAANVISAEDRARRMSQPRAELRGNNLVIQTCEDEQVITHGPAGTGKTLGWWTKINARMWSYRNLRVLVVRKVRADLAESALVTFERDILGYENPICKGARRQNRDTYQYPNGSLIALGGMDRPTRFLSSEWDIIYVPECNQLTFDEWQLLYSRLARDGAYPSPQLCGDTNPDRPDHWIQTSAKAGTLTLLPTTHKDNPKYWDDKLGEWTALGLRYVIGRLGRLVGILRKRYFEGLWVIADGAIFDIWDEETHVKDDDWLIAQGWLAERDGQIVPGARVVRCFGGQDWGFSKPGDQQIWLLDGDGRMLLVEETYMTRKLTGWWVAKAQAAQAQWGLDVLVCDPSMPASIEEMVQAGVNAVPAVNDIRDGIDRVYARLTVQDDGLPRMLVRRAAMAERDPDRAEKFEPCGLREEITIQVWKDKTTKEVPADVENHAVDVARYCAQEADMNRRMTVEENPFYN